MKNSIKIAFRNTLRNKRRTLLSVLAIAIGGFASLLIGSFIISINQGIQTGVARSSGHIHIHKKGFFDFGSADVSSYDMQDYEKTIKLIKNSSINKYINIITPTLNISGIAGNYAKNSSGTFVGVGIVAKDHYKMQFWDGYNLNMPQNKTLENFKKGGLIGKGLAINLNMCEELKIKNCKKAKEKINKNDIDEDIADFAIGLDIQKKATLSLLSASSSGMPNIVKLQISKVWQQENKAMDDRFIAVDLKIAQSLVYGKTKKAIDTINIQLNMPDNIDMVSLKLEQFFKQHNLNLEIIKLKTFNPQVDKVIGMFGVIFGFISIVIALIAIFTVSNTMTMSIMERYNEIGTIRSLGLKRSGVRTYFLLEGTILGIFGASLAVVLAIITTLIINNIGIMWTPPSSSQPVALVFGLLESPSFIFTIWAFLVSISIVSTLLPAIRASKMKIVDALRHN